MDISWLDNWFEANRERIRSGWHEFLRFPSISADPAHDADTRACAAWIVARLKKLGFAANLVETGAHPLVSAVRKGELDSQTVLIYGHYDVQPVDPIDKWKSNPFEPEEREGRIYARGAEDCKGQIFYLLTALEALIEKRIPLPTLKTAFEGDEECGGLAAADALAANPALAQADILYNCDCLAIAPGVPTIVAGLRGLSGLTVELHGASSDLHSGIHGGAAPNPALALARLLATLHNADGSAAVSGFYDGVKEPDAEELALSQAHSVSAKEYQHLTGVAPVGGERRFAPGVRTGLRPTIEVNGIHSGYGGPGHKTIIPASAMAKLTFRLVGGQDAEHCLACVAKHLKEHAPDGLRLEISEPFAAAPAFKVDHRHPLCQKAKALLERLSGREVAFHWDGGSVPIMSRLREISGAQPLLVGFGSIEDNIHAPNESFSWAQFHQGFRFSACFLGNI